MNQFTTKNRERQNQVQTPVNVNEEKEIGNGGERAQPQFPKEKSKKGGGWRSSNGQEYG